MSPAVEVRLADLDEFSRFLSSVAELLEALGEELDEPFTMTPSSRERLRPLRESVIQEAAALAVDVKRGKAA